MGNKKLAVTIIGCIAVVIIVVASAASPPTPEFSINVVPEKLNGDSIAGQHCVFLVAIADEGQESQLPVHISATAPGAEVIICKEDILGGEVAEVVVIPA
jgi:hypothetical protein